MKYIKTFSTYQDFTNESVDLDILQTLNEELKILGLEIPGTSEIETWGDLMGKLKEGFLSIITKLIFKAVSMGSSMFKALWSLIKSSHAALEKYRERNPKAHRIITLCLFTLLFLLISASQSKAATGIPGPISDAEIQAAIGWIKTQNFIFAEKPEGVTNTHMMIDAVNYLTDFLKDRKIDDSHYQAAADLAEKALKNIHMKKGAAEAGDQESYDILKKLWEAGAYTVEGILKSKAK